MNTKHIQTFLMVSAAFFAMSASMRPNSGAHALANAVTRTTQVGATSVAVNQRRSSEDAQRRG
ncbi:hypothetical protein J8I87_25035 [Paraburkholderia sp. LEh10]|jgi:hypothetical protein|uniref:hypothetical protein n=1 Tax=Paraburkholderia sp. LEh10 TaxID=2821353 RepID=UPI001AE37FED|nr:hypothetical protein [Paraburkholderia sp. LEh10]MBP0592937.1 hypothetical protein [Paraburkholderia sp. LEh10]